MSLRTILQREPAFILGLASAVLQMLIGFGIGLTTGEAAAINAIVAAALGVATSVYLARDQLVPALVGLSQAAITLGLAFGLGWSAGQVTMVMAVVAAAAAFFGVRPNVVASIDAYGRLVPRGTLSGPPPVAPPGARAA
jgi:hypothetical protein